MNIRLIIIILLFKITVAFGQTISDDAKKHFDRGTAAVEMAKSVKDYEAAIKEFQLAISIEPNWADAYYNLGLVQEKAEKYNDAVSSLKQYLVLAPNATDAETVKSLITKLDYKAENALTIDAIINVLLDFHNSATWTKTGEEAYFFPGFKDIGNNQLEVLLKDLYYHKPNEYFQTLNITGPVIKFSYTIDQCDPANPGPCPRVIEEDIQVVSKTYVKVKETLYWLNREKSKKHYFSAEYRKN